MCIRKGKLMVFETSVHAQVVAELANAYVPQVDLNIPKCKREFDGLITTKDPLESLKLVLCLIPYMLETVKLL